MVGTDVDILTAPDFHRMARSAIDSHDSCLP